MINSFWGLSNDQERTGTHLSGGYELIKRLDN